MKAVVQERYGSIDALEVREIDAPQVGDDQVLVRVRAASLHPDVWHVVNGRPYVLRVMGAGLFRPKRRIPGTDMAGVVEAVGKDVTRFRVGHEVFGETMPAHQWIHGGAFAEFVSAKEEWLECKPGNVTFEEAASVPTSGFIALQNLRSGRLIAQGSQVLVNGAGGGVGSLALQIAKARGAHVTGVDVAGKLDLMRSLGADQVLDCTRQDFTRSAERYDLIFDIPGNHPLSDCRRALKPDGKYVLIGHEQFRRSQRPVLGLFPRFFKLIFQSFLVGQLRLGRTSLPSRGEAMAILRGHLERGEITPVIDSTYPLSQVRAALRHMVEDETIGKVVLIP